MILRLHEDAEVSDEVWDNVIKSMCKHMQDKIPAVRVYSARALARFASADDGSGEVEDDAIILSTYRRSLQFDQNAVSTFAQICFHSIRFRSTFIMKWKIFTIFSLEEGMQI